MLMERELMYPLAASCCAAIAAVFDVKSRRIPNRLTGPAVLLAISLHGVFDGWRGAGNAVIAGAICGAVFLLFYLAGGMGAGDVKLMAAVGCFAGTANALNLLVFTALAGGVMAIAMVVMRGRWRETLGNVGAIVTHHAKAGLTPHPEIHVRNREQLRLPYGVAIAAGCLLTLWLQKVQG